jgi:diaminohydroxyphosphoribosylaminopyrimidine deaminase/5-amino-6-(5-phosphoribosylamino)uracil reductase
VDKLTEDKLWEFLLDVRKLVRIHWEDFQSMVAVLRKERWLLFINTFPEIESTDKVIAISGGMGLKFSVKSVLFQMDEKKQVCLTHNNWLDPESLKFILLYLPVCVLPIQSAQLKRCMSLLHLAQTLDGKIAACNGHSKWIGNQENLVHSHRLRALSDAILIGSHTLQTDKPRLTVRLVHGQDPVKVVMGDFNNEFGSLLENNGKVILVTSQEVQVAEGIEIISIPGNDRLIDTSVVLKELYKKGIHSLFIEGGSFTASAFLSARSIDTIQLFISPKLLGSGIPDFSLPEIQSIDDSIKFSIPSFVPMGDGILFSGNVIY